MIPSKTSACGFSSLVCVQIKHMTIQLVTLEALEVLGDSVTFGQKQNFIKNIIYMFFF